MDTVATARQLAENFFFREKRTGKEIQHKRLRLITKLSKLNREERKKQTKITDFVPRQFNKAQVHRMSAKKIILCFSKNESREKRWYSTAQLILT
jgi:hypothetical protein